MAEISNDPETMPAKKAILSQIRSCRCIAEYVSSAMPRVTAAHTKCSILVHASTRRSGAVLADDRQQAIERDRLLDHLSHARRRPVRCRRVHDDRDALEARPFPHLRVKFPAVHPWHQ